MSPPIANCAKRVAALGLALSVAGCGFSRVLADWKIDRLCKQDGGVKVFEKDVVPKEFLLPDGKIDSRRLARTTEVDRFRVIEMTKTLQSGEPSILRTEIRILRQRDQTLLGTAVTYVRPTDTLGAFSPFKVHHRCPAEAGLHQLIEAVFGIEGAWR